MTDNNAPRFGVSPLEAIQSCTGWDEIAVKKAFGSPLDHFSKSDRGMLGRALYFVMARREEGVSDQDAYRAAMDATTADLQAAFEDDPDDTMPEDPDSPAGKG